MQRTLFDADDPDPAAEPAPAPVAEPNLSLVRKLRERVPRGSIEELWGAANEYERLVLVDRDRLGMLLRKARERDAEAL